jgi:hypothetical protein
MPIIYPAGADRRPRIDRRSLCRSQTHAITRMILTALSCIINQSGMRVGSVGRFRIFLCVSLAALAVSVAGCSGFGGPKNAQQPAAAATAADPNIYPANYRSDLLDFLKQSLTQRADFRGAMIAPPMLRPIGDSQHYMVCLQFNGNSQLKSKVAIYLAGQITQFIDATPQYCAGAAYQPFPEREKVVPNQERESFGIYRG